MKSLRDLSIIIYAVVTGLVAGFPPPAATQDQSSVTGEWRAFYTGTGGEKLDFWLTLKQDGEKVTGTYLNQSIPGRPPISRPISGTFKDGVLEYGSTRAVVTGNTMTGTFPAANGVPREFTATRTK